MSPNTLIKILLFLSSSITFIVNGILMIKEKNNLNFQSLNKNQDIYLGIIIYTELYLGFILLYNFLFYMYKNFYSCCNDDNITPTFGCFKTLLILSGIGTHIGILYYLINNNIYITEHVNRISIIFISNMCFCIFIILIINIYKKCCKKNN